MVSYTRSRGFRPPANGMGEDWSARNGCNAEPRRLIDRRDVLGACDPVMANVSWPTARHRTPTRHHPHTINQPSNCGRIRSVRSSTIHPVHHRH